MTAALRSSVRMALLPPLLYLAVQVVYILTLPLVMDEFAFAHHVHQVGADIPYRDYEPYKTVLGYYLELPALLLAKDAWSSMIAVKLQLALLGAAALFFATLRLSSILPRRAVLGAMTALVCMSTFAERSTELRVDMLSAWVAFVGFVELLRGRRIPAGLAFGLSFLVSQKAAYFICGEVIATLVWVLLSRERLRAFREGVVLAIATAAPLGMYVGVFGALSSPVTVLHNIFIAHKAQALDDLYYLPHFWPVSISHNPAFYLLSALGLVIIGRELARPTRSETSVKLFVVVFVVTVLCFKHKQPWPYFIAMPTPFFAVALAVAIERLLSAGERLGARGHALVVTVLVMGLCAFPAQRVRAVLARDAGYQRNTVRALEQLLATDETYIALVNLLPARPQGLGILDWVDATVAQRMLDGPPERIKELTAGLEQAPIRYLVLNYRIDGLPQELYDSLGRDFSAGHVFGSLYAYSPKLTPEQTTFHLKLSGRYRLQLDGSPSPIVIDDVTYSAGDVVELLKGEHRVAIPAPVTLRAQIALPQIFLDHRYAEPQHFFFNNYDY
jgi:hypothetical protein